MVEDHAQTAGSETAAQKNASDNLKLTHPADDLWYVGLKKKPTVPEGKGDNDGSEGSPAVRS